MQALLEHFITQSTVYSLIAVVLVAFLESLALVGLILPGTVLMAGLGALIGSGELSFWHAWMAGIVGCLLGDWISFWLGWRFKKPLHRWSFLKKTKHYLIKLNMRCINTACLPFWSVVLSAQRVRWCQWWRECWISRWRNLSRRILSAACCGRRFTSCQGFWRVRRLIFLPECRVASLMVAAGDGGIFVGWGLAVLAVMAQRQSNRSFKSLFVARSFVVADAVDFCHRRGGAGGVNSPPVDAGVYRYFA